MFSFKEGLQNKMFFFKKINEIMPKIVSKTLFSCIATVLAFLGRDDDATRDHWVNGMEFGNDYCQYVTEMVERY